MRRTTTLALAALLLTGCGTTAGGGGTATIGTGAARERAAQIAREWPGSEAERAWSSGYFPLNERTEWLPSNIRESDRRAYADGLIEPRIPLPAADPTAEVVWPYGQRLTLPMLSPQQVLDRLRTGRPSCGPTGCEPPMELTGVARGSRTVATSRGQATVPVWEFTMAGYEEPFTLPAIAPQQQPATEPVRAWAGQSVTYRSVSADGLTVTGQVGRGSCDQALGTEAYETDQVVVLMAELKKSQEMCTAVLVSEPVSVRLTRPLDARLVLNLATGTPRAAW
ncbi:hypothetical protein ACIA8O_05140 [Kitasatospora sp. NPDC051853]|uniref:hypothetical protein n=1 Tax=Kitasatospora sp. NPDC051853 TaxID=3364058 RepID=UPI0037A7F271